MKWFLGTYTIRNNARHRLRGHPFSGRYKALIKQWRVEEETRAYGPIRRGWFLGGEGGAPGIFEKALAKPRTQWEWRNLEGSS